jgi:hypothetical protein
MNPKWIKDSDGDYTLTSHTGQSAWIAKSSGSRNQKPWNGRATNTAGERVRISTWTLKAAKRDAEKALGL